ncbi:predicted protein [Sclerotinia sclerotiorum 1980 UF-70]|uniref:Uncharacterized protein n=1 Tax=Sclerotinia sclerotiorum (strain ATCC 18683 / 1980 / Ss-1) TaxID=665079 RepID=A7F715_SCLS1|nr:predicted protein [Sclerotinia sclerotiorum 1980 UF-70]EDN98536.1 predicted protein [Sclerotinia sclerotiorum 1980 UF-70]
MNAECCIFKETFSDVCGHVTTVIEHQYFCTKDQHDRLPEFDPYPDSSKLEKGLQLHFDHHYDESSRWAVADIADKTWDHLSWKMTRAKKMLDFYDADQNRYLFSVRARGYGKKESLFDPEYVTCLTNDLFYHVKPEKIPSGEICSICKEALDSPENRVEVVHIVGMNCEEVALYDRC